jgi:hypothetical protein
MNNRTAVTPAAMLSCRAGNQEVLHHLPATQLLLLHQPVARHLLMKPGMLQSLLELWRNVAACYIDEHGECNGQLMYGCLVPSSSWSMADGSLQLEEECVPGALQEVCMSVILAAVATPSIRSSSHRRRLLCA